MKARFLTARVLDMNCNLFRENTTNKREETDTRKWIARHIPVVRSVSVYITIEMLFKKEVLREVT